MYIYVCEYTSLYIYTHTRTLAQSHTGERRQINRAASGCVFSRVSYTDIYIILYVCIYMYVYILNYIHTHTHTHTHAITHR